MVWTNKGTPGAIARALAAGALATGTLTASAGCVPALGGADERKAGDRAPGVAAAECPDAPRPDGTKGRRLRGMWIATVGNIDWPKDGHRAADQQKADFRKLLDHARAMNLNAVFVQIRPNSDAFYDSPYEPWSQWITGTPGKDPGYDVLKFMLDEAHARGLEFHAWFNPYRVSRQGDVNKLAPDSPARRHPDWVRKYGKGLWYDPGLPEVRDLVVKAVMDVVRKYDIDAVHFDDYFYPYPEAGAGEFPDQATYKTYGKGMGKDAWRRQNVDTLVKTVSERVHQAKPWVRFGISPFGVWRNDTSDPAGSPTRALQSYDDIHADTRKWIREGWIDYVTPQLYWTIGDPRADYAKLVEWWARQVQGTKVQLTIGQAAYRVGKDAAWRKPDELSRHLKLNARYPQVRGDVYFSASDLVENRHGFAARLRNDHYTTPALPPVAPAAADKSKAGDGPAPAHSVRAEATDGGVRVTWGASEDAAGYAVYRVDGERPGCAGVAPEALLTAVRGGGILDPTAKAGRTYTYYVTAVDRMQRESAPARGATVTARRG
ncbi:glycoside hydrolase family 10 protein [Actinomadura keratinilytica]|jgi:uncharacterized lipoprotein YddW (UPF0748 family)|uniref:Family 10 glycosylhydrolase n=1 Tax=Actinomadura keratinilytica TaxID=547461 RepID=A0ABP7ZHF7_9ACTN